MPAHFTVSHARAYNGFWQIHMTLDRGNPNHVYLNLTAQVFSEVFGAEIAEGDMFELIATRIPQGANGTKSG